MELWGVEYFYSQITVNREGGHCGEISSVFDCKSDNKEVP